MDDQETCTVIVLDRIEPGVTPEYCCHGRTPCIRCQEWCWLGHSSFDVVFTGQAVGVCKQCANTVIPAGTEVASRAVDHLRKDGPHV